MSKGKQQLYVSTAALKEKKDLAKVIEEYHAMGLHYVEISGGHDYKSQEELTTLIRKFQDKGMTFIFHNYFPAPQKPFVLNCLSKDDGIKRQSQDLVLNAVRLAKELKVDLYCLHPGYLSDPYIGDDGMFHFDENINEENKWYNAFFEDFMSYYHQLPLKNGSHQVYVGIENLFPPQLGDNHSIFCTIDEVNKIFENESVKKSDLGILIDLAHLTIAANILKFDRDEYIDEIIKKYGDRIYEVHLSGNDGCFDAHNPVEADSWQVGILGKFKNTGMKCQSGPTRFCLESRGLTGQELLDNYHVIKKYVEDIG